MQQEKQYYAFISYKREDEAWAKWLAKKIENYNLPTTLNGKELPKSLRPVFRDTDELSAGNLPKQIYDGECITSATFFNNQLRVLVTTDKALYVFEIVDFDDLCIYWNRKLAS